MGIRNVPRIEGDVPDRVEIVALSGGGSQTYLLTPGGLEPGGAIVLQ